jgi:hypothetical protein
MKMKMESKKMPMKRKTLQKETIKNNEGNIKMRDTVDQMKKIVKVKGP